jgi:hypothetical protein
MTDIYYLRYELNNLMNKKNDILQKIYLCQNNITNLALEYITTNHLNVTTPIEYVHLYPIDVIETHIKDLFGYNVIWGDIPHSNLVNNPYFIFDPTTPVLLPMLKYMNSIEYLSPDQYKFKLITYLTNTGVHNNIKSPLFCKYCKEGGHEIHNCHNMICSYCEEQGHTIKNCHVVPCNFCGTLGHRKFQICLKTGNKIITCPKITMKN